MGTDLEQARINRIADTAEQLADDFGTLERDLFDRINKDLKDNRIFGPAAAQTLLNVSKAKALQIEKVASPLQNRPTAIVQHTAQEIWAELQRLNPQVDWRQIAETVDSTAEELDPPQ